MIFPPVGVDGVVDFLVDHLHLDLQNIAKFMGRSRDDAVLLVHLILYGIVQQQVTG